MQIPLFKIMWDQEDVDAVSEVIKRGTFWAIGPNIDLFEKGISDYIGSKYCVTFNSGTSALHSTLLAYGIKGGDEVIVPSFTFIATANTPLFVGAKPVFADIEEKTFGLDPESVKEKITNKTKAIIPVHFGGCPCYIKELREIADDNNLLLIEDAAESFGAMVDSKKVGTFGDSSILSFCQNKIITTGEGGCVVTDSKDVFEKLKLIRSHGRLETSNYFTSMEYMDYVDLGYNFRMSDLTAACGVSQLKKTNKIIEFRRKNAKSMTNLLSKIDDISIPFTPSNFYNVYQMYTILVKGSESIRNGLMQHLYKNGISSKVYFYPVHLTSFYTKVHNHSIGELPITEKISKHVLTLPLYPELSLDEMDRIYYYINEYFHK